MAAQSPPVATGGISRDTGLRERASELLILDPLVLNDATPAPGGVPVEGYRYRLPVQGGLYLCRSLVAIGSEQLAGREVCKSRDYADWRITLVAPDSRVLHRDIPLTFFLRNFQGLGSPSFAFRAYFGEGNIWDARQSYVVINRGGVVASSRKVALRFIYAN